MGQSTFHSSMGDDSEWVSSSYDVSADHQQASPPPIETTPPQAQQPAQASAEGIAALMSDNTIQGHLAREMYGRGKEKAQGFLNLYANIDLIRPYFDVEPVEVLFRLLFSLLPLRNPKDPASDEDDLNLDQPVSTRKPDLYGPLMLCFTLGSVLLVGLQSSHQTGGRVEEGTILGTALFMCFCFLFVSAVVIYFLAFMFNTNANFLQVLSFAGYAQFGLCVALLLSFFISSSTYHWLVLITLGSLSALSLAAKLFRRTPQRKHGVVLAIAVLVIQVGYLLYLTQVALKPERLVPEMNL